MKFQAFHVNPGEKLRKKMLITILAILCQSFLLSSSPRLLILVLGNCRLGQNWSIFSWKFFLTQKFKILSKFQSFWAIVVICNPSGSKVRHTGWNFLGPQIALQMTCNGQIAEPNPNEHVLAGAFQGNLLLSPNFFFELLTSYTHLFNTEPRFFDHFLNFPATANVQRMFYIINRRTIHILQCNFEFTLYLYICHR